MNQSRKCKLPPAGGEIHGFRAVEEGRIRPLAAQTLSFYHRQSGAQLLCIQNSDRELGFSVIYRTPYLDESDANHALEHAVLTASSKYPGRDIFFDAVGKSYSTVINAYTYPVMTCFPLCSRSGDQLMKLADVYLSCLTDPAFLREPNIFRREAVRYELRDRDQDLTLAGTVYGEDFGYLTDIAAEASHNMAHALYPGLRAANCVGRAHRNAGELTEEKIRKLYEDFYVFDNALIVLYGDMDFDVMMEFLDREYLSRCHRSSMTGRDGCTDRGEAVRSLFDEKSPEGSVEKVCQCPSYEGDSEEWASVVELGIDVSDLTFEEQLQLDFLTDMLDHENSLFHRYLREAGIQNRAYCDLSQDGSKNYFLMGIEDAEEEQKEAFRQAAERALVETARVGPDPEVAEAVVKDREFSLRLAREGSGVGADVSAAVGLYWAVTGKTDYYACREAALARVKGEGGQRLLRELAGRLVRAGRRALVVTVPRPGLAEELERRREGELALRKAAMTESEIDALIRETEAFDRWNGLERQEKSFAAGLEDLQSLPEPAAPAPVMEKPLGAVRSYTSPAESDGTYCCRLLFDTSAVREEDLHYLSLWAFLLLELDTGRLSVERQKLLELKYAGRLSVDFAYPGPQAGENHHPMLSVKWYGLTEDFETGLDFILEVLRGTRFDDGEKIAGLMEKYMYDYDLSRTGDPLSTAVDLAAGSVDLYQRYRNYIEGQPFYRFLVDTLSRLEEEKGFAAVLQDRLEQAVGAAVHSRRLCALTAAPAAELPRMERILEEKLNALPPEARQGMPRELPYPFLQRKEKGRSAICIEASDQSCVRMTSFGEEPGFQGRYLVWLTAAADRFLVPHLRFEGGAYGAGTAFRIWLEQMYLYTFGDPGAGSTLEALDRVWDQMARAEFSQEELLGYILGTCAAAEKPAGPLNSAMNALSQAVEGVDPQTGLQVTADIRSASLQDQAEAVAYLKRAFDRARTVVLGNEKRLSADRKYFDEFLDERL